MQIIGEKINGTRKNVAAAIADRDAARIQELALKQTEAGVDFLDLNAGTHPSKEIDALTWLIETVQAVTDVRLCLDSPNPAALAAGLEVTARTPMINSISGEPDRLSGILPLAAAHNCPVIALAMDEKSVPASAEARLEIVHRILDATRREGLADELIYVDVLAMTLGTNVDSANISIETIRRVREHYPEVHITVGLSNISFGLPARSYVNRVFLSLAMAAGLDSAILDPLDKELRATMLATQLVLGQDRHCLNYTRAYRAGLFG